MKKIILLCVTAALLVSCKNLEKGSKYPDMVADIDPYQVGSVNAFFDQPFSSKVKEAAVEVFFYPRENEVALEFSYSTGQYRQFWSKEGRRLFTEALNRYKEDFANQNLSTKTNKTRAVYGKVNSRFQWRTLKISSLYRASPVIELGYRFRDDAPYLAARQTKAKEESGKNNEGIKESPQYSIYFTRAQAEELAAIFDQAFLLKSLEGKDIPAQTTDSGRDEYYQQNTARPEQPDTVPPEPEDDE